MRSSELFSIIMYQDQCFSFTPSGAISQKFLHLNAFIKFVFAEALEGNTNNNINDADVLDNNDLDVRKFMRSHAYLSITVKRGWCEC